MAALAHPCASRHLHNPCAMAGVQGIVGNNPCLLRSTSSIPGLVTPASDRHGWPLSHSPCASRHLHIPVQWRECRGMSGTIPACFALTRPSMDSSALASCFALPRPSMDSAVESRVRRRAWSRAGSARVVAGEFALPPATAIALSGGRARRGRCRWVCPREAPRASHRRPCRKRRLCPRRAPTPILARPAE